MEQYQFKWMFDSYKYKKLRKASLMKIGVWKCLDFNSRYEDLRALDGGADGLSVIVPILKFSSKSLRPGGHLFLETDPCHSFLIPEKLKLLKNEDPNFGMVLQRTVKDFAEKDRFIEFQKIVVWLSKLLFKNSKYNLSHVEHIPYINYC